MGSQSNDKTTLLRPGDDIEDDIEDDNTEDDDDTTMTGV
jgi:hypothetical protein